MENPFSFHWQEGMGNQDDAGSRMGVAAISSIAEYDVLRHQPEIILRRYLILEKQRWPIIFSYCQLVADLEAFLKTHFSQRMVPFAKLVLG
jgi:hypothetical protein